MYMPVKQAAEKLGISDRRSRYTYNSNAIEGNTLTLRETNMVLRSLVHRIKIN